MRGLKVSLGCLTSSRLARTAAGVAISVLVVVSPVTAAGAFAAADHFQRNITGGWGQASPGGSYTLNGPASDFWVSDVTYPRGLGYMRVPARGLGRGALLRQVRATNVELRFSVFMTAPAGDGPYYVYGVARSDGSSEFRVQVIYNRDCSVSMGGSVVASGREQALRSSVKVPAANWCAGSSNARIVSVRAQLFGSSPATLRIKAWSPGSSQPAQPQGWQWSGTTSTALLSDRQAVGLRTYASSRAGNRAVTFAFYNWVAQLI